MFSRRTVAAAGLAAVTTLTGLAACSSSGSKSSPSSGAGSSAPARFTAATLRGALLSKINGAAPLGGATTGGYSSLPQVRLAAKPAAGITVTPKACLQAMSLAGAYMAGTSSSSAAPDAGAPALSFGTAPAAAVSFHVGHNGVSEVLASPADAQAAAALGSKLPAACAHYTATSGGKTYRYAIQEAALTGIGKQARVTSVMSSAQPTGNVWSVLYRGDGFVGTITVVGPNASEAAAKELAQQAYAFAAQTLK